MRNYGLLILGLAAACSKAEPSEPLPGSNKAPAVVAPTTAAPSSEPAATAAPVSAAPQQARPAGAPSSFEAGTKESLAGAVGLGCEATRLDGWLQLLCRKKNGTGGRPVRATITTPGAVPAPQAGAEPAEGARLAAGDELLPNQHGELGIVVPYRDDEKRDVSIEWSDTRYTLHVTGAKATLEWAGAVLSHRRACQQLLGESKAVLANAQKAEGEARLTSAEADKLRRFGVCQPGGLGSWALALKTAAGKGEGATREHHLELDVVRVDIEGKRTTTSFGALDVTPGGLELGALQVYDYDDDGRDELIVPYEVKGTLAASQPLPSAVWSFTDSAVSAYAKAPPVSGGVGIEQLDFDMRPDVGSYGEFVAYFGADCGIKACPARLTGPKLYQHSLPDGSFSSTDDTARSALKRACPAKPTNIVVDGGAGLNAALTATNLVCAKVWESDMPAVRAELTAKRPALCGAAASCPLSVALEAWLDKAIPLTLTPAAKQ